SASWLAAEHDVTDAAAPSQIAFWLFVMKDALELHTVRTLSLIASAPEVQRRLHDEIRNGEELTAEANANQTFLEACIKEQLRLWTPIPILLRVALESTELPGGLRVAKGQQILLHTGWYHRDTEVFGVAAEKFSPAERVKNERPCPHSVTNS